MLGFNQDNASRSKEQIGGITARWLLAQQKDVDSHEGKEQH